MPILLRSLQKSDVREGFHSGQPDLDHFFHRYAGQNQFRYHIGVTYIAIEEATLYGYVTLASGSLESDHLLLSGKFPANYPLPILRLGRLAVDMRYQERGIGKLLMRHVFQMALQQQESVGCIGIVVDAKPDAISFYELYGFQRISQVVEGTVKGYPNPLPMFLPIKSLPLP